MITTHLVFFFFGGAGGIPAPELIRIEAESVRYATIEEIAAVAQTFAAMSLTDAPLVYYRLNDVAAPFQDASGNGRHGTLHVGTQAPTYGVAGALAGDTDRAVHFNGTGASGAGSELETPASLDDLGAPAFTIEVWAKLASPVEAMIALKGNGASEAGMQWWFWWRGNTFDFSIWNHLAQRTTLFPVGLPAGPNYRHLVGTFDGAFIRLYVDGVLAASAAFSGTLQIPAPRRLYVSAGVSVPSYPFAGPLDEVKFYGAALSAARVAEYYQKGVSGPGALAFTSNFGVPTITDETLVVAG